MQKTKSERSSPENSGPRSREGFDAGTPTIDAAAVACYLCMECVTVSIGLPIFAIWSPPGLVGRELFMVVFAGVLAIEGAVLVLVLFLNLLAPRFFCRYLCPLGGLLALIGARRRLRVVLDRNACTACGTCDEGCPMGIRPSAGEAQSVYCWNCGECVANCSEGATGFRVRRP